MSPSLTRDFLGVFGSSGSDSTTGSASASTMASEASSLPTASASPSVLESALTTKSSLDIAATMGQKLDPNELDETLESETRAELEEERREKEAENPSFTGGWWVGFLGIVIRACKPQIHQFSLQTLLKHTHKHTQHTRWDRENTWGRALEAMIWELGFWEMKIERESRGNGSVDGWWMMDWWIGRRQR